MVDLSVLSERPSYVKVDTAIPEEKAAGRLLYASLVAVGSKCLIKADERYIPNAEAGNILIKAEEPVLIDGDEGLVFIPIATRDTYSIKDDKGVYIGHYSKEEEAKQSIVGSTQSIITNMEFLVLAEDERINMPLVISFNSPSKYGVGRELRQHFHKLQSMEGCKYKLTSTQQYNKKKDIYYYNYAIEPVGWVSEEELKMAQEVKSGMDTFILKSEEEAPTLIEEKRNAPIM